MLLEREFRHGIEWSFPYQSRAHCAPVYSITQRNPRRILLSQSDFWDTARCSCPHGQDRRASAVDIVPENLGGQKRWYPAARSKGALSFRRTALQDHQSSGPWPTQICPWSFAMRERSWLVYSLMRP